MMAYEPWPGYNDWIASGGGFQMPAGDWNYYANGGAFNDLVAEYANALATPTVTPTPAPAQPTKSTNSMAPMQAYRAQQSTGRQLPQMSTYQSGNYSGLAPMAMYQQTQAPVATTPTTATTPAVGGK